MDKELPYINKMLSERNYINLIKAGIKFRENLNLDLNCMFKYLRYSEPLNVVLNVSFL